MTLESEMNALVMDRLKVVNAELTKILTQLAGQVHPQTCMAEGMLMVARDAVREAEDLLLR